MAFVHGDNFVISTHRRHVQWFVTELGKHMIVNVEAVLGPDPARGDSRECHCLNRIFRYVAGGASSQDAIEIEADPRHAELIVEQLQLDSLKGLSTPGIC